MLTTDSLKLIADNLFLFPILMTRFIASFSSLAFFRREVVPTRVIIIFSLACTLFVLAHSLLLQKSFDNSTYTIYYSILMQLFLGLLTGFIINVFFEIFIAFGQIISLQSGLSFVNLYVPKVGNITALSNFFFITATVLFFQLNGHLILIKMIMDACHTQFLYVSGLNADFLLELLLFIKIIFKSSLMLSLSLLIALLITNITIAVMTKFSPQLNVLSFSINITLLICFFLLYLCFDAMLMQGTILLNDMITFLGKVL